MNNSIFPECERVDDALIQIDLTHQTLFCFYRNRMIAEYQVSTAKNGPGELDNSGCTPRGWHEIAEIIGLNNKKNSVFIGREWTGEIYSSCLASKFPQRDWILSRIIRLKGLELGRNLGPGVDTYDRYIYIHGTSDEESIGVANSHGCIRMRNDDVIKLSDWVKKGVKVMIKT